MIGSVATRHTNSRGGNWQRVFQFLFATLVFGLSLLIAAPFFAVVLLPFYFTFYFNGLHP